MKPHHKSNLLGFLLAATATFAGSAPALAQSVAPVPAPTIISTAPYTITAAGYYQLGANLNYAGTGATNDAIITIAASNVTLDFAGHFIAGPSTNAATTLNGIYAFERSNVKIQNGAIAFCYFGINLNGLASQNTNHLNPLITNMTVTKCYQTGISIAHAILPEVSSCRVSSVGGSTTGANLDGVGIVCDTSIAAKVSNCTVANITAEGSGSSYGLYAPGFATRNTIYGCTIGIQYANKYQDNLTYNCFTPFAGSNDAGGNN